VGEAPKPPGWEVFWLGGRLQVLPVAEEPCHVEGPDCWCEPQIQWENGVPIDVHAAQDGRP
jgi:hypothetical protein